MSSETVVFVNSIRCPSCGLLTSGYLRVKGKGRGATTCSRCGAAIVQDIPPGAVHQVAPHGHVEPRPTHTRHSEYAWLYVQPKERPSFCLSDLIRVGVSPAKALSRVYLRSDLGHAMAIVIILVAISNITGAVVTESMADVLGFGAVDAIGFMAEILFGVIITTFSLLVFAVIASVASREVFGGRGDKGSTIVLVSYCYPWFVMLTIVMLGVFAWGFEGLNLDRVEHWTDAEMERAIIVGAALLSVAVLGFAWLLWMVSKAIGIANDVRTGQAASCAVLAVIAAGVVYLLVGAVVRLPIGINL